MNERERLIGELTRLVPSRRAREIHLRRDDAALAAAIERMKQVEARVKRYGHVATAGVDLRVVGRADDAT